MAPTKTVPADGSLAITQTRSGIGTKPKHRATLRALGLGRIGKSRVVPDRPEIRGMLAVVAHLVEVTGATPTTPKRADSAATPEEAG